MNRMEVDPEGLLRDLVATPSVTGREEEVRRLIVEVLEEHGVPYEVDGMGNVLAGDLSGVVLNAHMDTVPAGDGWRVTDPYEPRTVGGRLYGRGAADCKGGLAAAVSAVVEARYEGLPLGLLATVGEESPSEEDNGTLYACRRGLDALGGIVCEPTDGEVHVGDRGRITLEVVIRGRSAHASQPERGKNPIEAAAKVVEELSRLEPSRRRVRGVGRVESSLSVTRIEADGPSNVIPNECRLTVDYRSIPGDTPDSVRRRVERAARRAAPGYEVEVLVRHASRATAVDADSRVVRWVVREVRREGMEGRIGFKLGHCDIEYLVHEAGVDSVIFGPKGGNIHGPDEWVDVESVRRCARVYLRVGKRAARN